MCWQPLNPCQVAFLPLPADPRLVPGGGAVEMAVSRGLAERANSGAVEGVEQVRPLLVWQAGRQGGWFESLISLLKSVGLPLHQWLALPGTHPFVSLPSLPCLPACLHHLAACPLQGPYRAVGQALEVIPRTLAQNCGANVIRTLTKLRAKHADAANCTYGINGEDRESWKGAWGGRQKSCRAWLLAGVGCLRASSGALHVQALPPPHHCWPSHHPPTPCLPRLPGMSRNSLHPQATAARLWT